MENQVAIWNRKVIRTLIIASAHSFSSNKSGEHLIEVFIYRRSFEIKKQTVINNFTREKATIIFLIFYTNQSS